MWKSKTRTGIITTPPPNPVKAPRRPAKTEKSTSSTEKASKLKFYPVAKSEIPLLMCILAINIARPQLKKHFIS